MELFTYLMAKKGHNTHRDLFSYLLGKNAGGSGTYTTFSGTSLNISNTLQAKIKNIALEGNTSQDGTPTPDTPIPIKVVTGEQNVEISGKNLYDESKITDVSTYRATATINNDKSITITSTGTNGYAIIRPFFNFKANETYTVSFNVDNVNNFNHMYLFISTTTTAGGYSKNPYVTITKTTDSLLGIGIYPNANATVTISNIQIEKNTSKTSYEPYQGQNYPLSLGNIELAKIGDYADQFFKNTIDSEFYDSTLLENEWYLKKSIGKVIFNGGETWSLTPKDGYYAFWKFNYTVGNNVLDKAHKKYCDKFIYNSNPFTEAPVPSICENSGRAMFIFNTNGSQGTTVSEWQSWLSSNNLIVYYVLATPQYIHISETDYPILIQQLENINNNARSYKGTTIIECTSESTDNEVIGFSGDIKVASVSLGNSLNTSLLSSNIQEEPNLDDVNEIEEIEEPIEEEVS